MVLLTDLLTILLIEDEPTECAEIIQYIEQTEDAKLIAVTNTVDGALKYAQDCLPDAIILDLELHKGGGNGIQFLQELRNLNPKPFPYILVTTNNTSSVTHESSRRLGADFLMVKSQRGYSAQGAVDFLRALKEAIFETQKRRNFSSNQADSPDQVRKRLIQRVSAEIDRVGVSPKATGRKYLLDGILLIVGGLTSGICTEIGKMYAKTDASVERAMQNAINVAWRKTDIEDLQKYYTARIGSAKGVPTVTEFLHHYAEKLKIEY